MEKAFSHTHITSRNETTWFQQLGIVMAARYGGRAFFDLLVDAGKLTKKGADIWTSAFSGAIATAISFIVTRSDYRNIKHIFSETVALELSKDAKDITWRDLKQSENLLVKDAMKEFSKLNISNLFGISGFFLSMLPIPVFGLKRKDDLHNLKGEVIAPKDSSLFLNDAAPMEIGMFTFGVRSALEGYRERSMTEIMGPLLADDFNENGMGHSMTAAKLGQFYQAYARRHAPDRKFSDVSDIALWSGAEILFERMANLMENSYRQRANIAEIARGDATEIRVIAQEHFKMPTFLYLLGHGMINPEKVRDSLAYVEIVNRYGIAVLKDAHEAIGRGASLEQIFETYPVTLPGENLEVVAAPNKHALIDLPLENPTRAAPGFAEKIGRREALDRPIAPSNPIAAHLDRPETQIGKLAQQQATAVAGQGI